MNKKTVWITGASSGIGQEFARRYARLGFRLILTARRKDRLDALAEELQNRYHVPCRVLPADLERDVDCEALCTVLAAERIDLFINNAGFGTCGCFLDTDPEKELSMLRVNVLAMHRLFKFVLKKMDRQGSGTILNVASSAGLLPAGPFMAGYYASKAYVVSLTRGRGRGAAGAAQPGLRLRALPRPGEHRVQRPRRRRLRAQGHLAGTLRGRSHARDAPPQDHHRALGPDAGRHHGPKTRARPAAHAHPRPAAEAEAGPVIDFCPPTRYTNVRHAPPSAYFWMAVEHHAIAGGIFP